MPKPYPKEFRDDVVAVARSRPNGTTLKQIATDFGISDSCLANWLAVADADEGRRAGPSSEEISELRVAKRRIRLLEQENEVLAARRTISPRGTCPQNDVPARPRAGR
jgi:transposase